MITFVKDSKSNLMPRKPPEYDYLKYWRVIRYYIKARYGITTSDLDMILFLRSEGRFNRSKFNEFNEVFGWDKGRFERLLRNEWISVFRKKSGNYASQAALYEVSYKGKRMLTAMYRKLSGEEVSINNQVNPMFLKNVGYNDKVYRNMLIEMNAFIKQQQRQKDL
tara:strand:- start:1708 stop:2202 length:495 start_codon:yes stop_codon:yes gene_type:complete